MFVLDLKNGIAIGPFFTIKALHSYAQNEGLHKDKYNVMPVLPDSESLGIPPKEQYHEPTT